MRHRRVGPKNRVLTSASNSSRSEPNHGKDRLRETRHGTCFEFSEGGSVLQEISADFQKKQRGIPLKASQLVICAKCVRRS